VLRERNGLLNHYMHMTMSSMLKSTTITVGYLLGSTINTTTLFHGSNLIDWLRWPLWILPEFKKGVTDTMRAAAKV
jgi:hypothetical protein